MEAFIEAFIKAFAEAFVEVAMEVAVDIAADIATSGLGYRLQIWLVVPVVRTELEFDCGSGNP